MKTCWSLQVMMRASVIPDTESCQYLRSLSLGERERAYHRSLPRLGVTYSCESLSTPRRTFLIIHHIVLMIARSSDTAVTQRNAPRTYGSVSPGWKIRAAYGLTPAPAISGSPGNPPREISPRRVAMELSGDMTTLQLTSTP